MISETILFDLAEQLEEVSLDFLKENQKKSNLIPKIFWYELCDIWQYFACKFHGEETPERLLGMQKAFLPLTLIFRKKPNLFSNDGLTEEGIRITFNYLVDYGFKENLVLYYYEYENLTVPITYKASPTKIFKIIKVNNELTFERELRSKEPDQIANFLDFHLRGFKRKNGNVSEWLSNTKKHLPISFTPQQKDAFYSWFESMRDGISTPPQQKETKVPVMKPTFKPEAVEQIFNLLKDFFSSEHQQQLKKVLETGDNSSEPLLFKWHGKSLLDFFKQLMKGHFLLSPVQADFEKWVSNNFMYLDKNKPKYFTPKYSSKVISGNERPAKGNRLIDITKNDKGIFEIIQAEIKNRQQTE